MALYFMTSPMSLLTVDPGPLLIDNFTKLYFTTVAPSSFAMGKVSHRDENLHHLACKDGLEK